MVGASHLYDYSRTHILFSTPSLFVIKQRKRCLDISSTSLVPHRSSHYHDFYHATAWHTMIDADYSHFFFHFLTFYLMSAILMIRRQRQGKTTLSSNLLGD